MRKLAIMALLFGCVYANARQISPGEAMTLASGFMNSMELKAASGSKTLTPMMAPGVNAEVASPYYVFNRGESDGFVIIAGDDRAPKILGYSDRGSFDANNIPPQLKSMMEQWTTQMGQLPAGAEQHPSWGMAPSTRAEEGLLHETADWGQGAPFNDLCPTVGGQKAPAGCVATAMAIAMKYHNWPDAARGGMEYDFYTPSETFDFDSYTIDWDALSDKENPKFADEVAKLTYSAGVAAQMAYGPNESAAVSWTLGHLLQYFYAYDKDCQVISRDIFDDTQWNSMLKEQLENVGPVIYFGNGAGGESGVYGEDGDETPVGHCFVVDGYDAEGLYHVNWGWNGESNGYFDLDFSVGDSTFNNFQGMVINMRPDNEKNIYSRAWIPNMEVYMGSEVNDWNFMNPDIEYGVPLTFKTPALCISRFQGYIGLAVVDQKDKIVKLIDESANRQDGHRYFCSMPGSTFFAYYNVLLPELNDGERYQMVSQEVPNKYEGEEAEQMYDPAEPPSSDPSDWSIVLGGMIHPSYFYASGNPSNISEIRIHIQEDMPSFCPSLNSYDKEFTLHELKGLACPATFHIPAKGSEYEIKCFNNDGTPVEPIYVTWDSEVMDTFLGINISLYADQYDVYFKYNSDGDTRKDSEVPSDMIVENDGLVYRKLSEGLELIGYDKVEDTVIIPKSILVDGNEMPVISLADMSLAFAPVKHIEIYPDSLSIGNMVLAGTAQLETLSIKDLVTSFSDIYNPFSRLMLVNSGLKKVYFDSVPKDGNLFVALTGHEYAHNAQADKWTGVSVTEDVDFIVTAIPADVEDNEYFAALKSFSTKTMADEVYSSINSYLIPGLGDTTVIKQKDEIRFNIRQMWTYNIRKNNQVRLDSILPEVKIENVLINGAVAEIGANGYYAVDLDSLSRSGESNGPDVVVSYLINGIKKSTHYSPEYNLSVMSSDNTIMVDSIAFTPESWSGKEGESFTIAATVLPENATDKTLVWSSSDATIAAVDSVGNVKALRIGEAVITAKAADGSDISASCSVKVNPVLVDSIAFTPESWSGKEGESFTIAATVLPENATDKTLLWSSSDATIAAVDSVGNVKALRIGEAVITAKAADGSDISASCSVKVNPVLVDSIALTPESWSGKEGESFTIAATVLPENTTDKTLVWSSSDATIASVDSVGNVKALRIGEAVITAKAADGSDISAICSVKVNPVLADSIQISQKEATLNTGETLTLTVTVLPENATDKSVIWTSSDKEIATVDANGTVTAVAVGTATITAACGEVSASCIVTVEPILVESIQLTPDNWSGIEGDSFSITAVVLPENATDSSIEWTSSDESVATVDAEGNVSVLKVGTCVITATATDGSGIYAECIITGTSGIDGIFSGSDRFDIYDLGGLRIKKDADREALKMLTPGIYILSNGVEMKKLVIR